MPLEARHPDEVALHHELRDAFNQRLSSKGFFVWIDVRPTGKARRFRHLDRLVEETDRWLNRRDPDAVKPSELPELPLEDEAATVRITAIPRKREVRAQRAAEIVGNPGPVLVGWNG